MFKDRLKIDIFDKNKNLFEQNRCKCINPKIIKAYRNVIKFAFNGFEGFDKFDFCETCRGVYWKINEELNKEKIKEISSYFTPLYLTKLLYKIDIINKFFNNEKINQIIVSLDNFKYVVENFGLDISWNKNDSNHFIDKFWELLYKVANTLSSIGYLICLGKVNDINVLIRSIWETLFLFLFILKNRMLKFKDIENWYGGKKIKIKDKTISLHSIMEDIFNEKDIENIFNICDFNQEDMNNCKKSLNDFVHMNSILNLTNEINSIKIDIKILNDIKMSLDMIIKFSFLYIIIKFPEYCLPYSEIETLSDEEIKNFSNLLCEPLKKFCQCCLSSKELEKLKEITTFLNI